jgi:hypothetical protein
MTSNGLLDRVSAVNVSLGELLLRARQALRGESVFGVEQVRELSRNIAEMAPLCAQASELRLLRRDMDGELDLYKSQLGELGSTLQQVRLMLLSQRAQMEANRAQLAAVSHWASTLMNTR